MAAARTRAEPYYLLADRGIPSLVWFEDAILQHGVPTVVFDYFLLVPDIQQAACTLSDAGWKVDADWKPLVWNFLGGKKDSHLHYRRLDPPLELTPALEKRLETYKMGDPAHDGRPASTMLLPATAWGVNLSELQSYSPIPPLPTLLDGLITSCHNASPGNSSALDHLVLMLSYLTGYSTAIKSPSLEESLRAENRPFYRHLLEDPDRLSMPLLAE